MILSYLRTLVLYLVLIAVIRIMGKRQIGEMAPTEFVVTMLAANLAAIPMQDGGIPLFGGVVPILTVLGAELVLSGLSLRSIPLRRLLCGKPVILIENGRILQRNLRATRITMDELTGRLRGKDVPDPAQVRFAILETDGSLSVFPDPQYLPPSARDAGIRTEPLSLPVTLVSDGHLLAENLDRAGRDRAWVEKTLKDRGVTLEQTWLLTVDDSGKVCQLVREDAS